MKYEKIPHLSKADIVARFKTAQGYDVCTLIYALVHANDPTWSQNMILGYLQDPDDWVSRAAITALGDLARVAGLSDPENIKSKLQDLKNTRPVHTGRIQDALLDIEQFKKNHRT